MHAKRSPRTIFVSANRQQVRAVESDKFGKRQWSTTSHPKHRAPIVLAAELPLLLMSPKRLAHVDFRWAAIQRMQWFTMAL